MKVAESERNVQREKMGQRLVKTFVVRHYLLEINADSGIQAMKA